MAKITLERGSWGDYTAYIDGVKFERPKDSVILDSSKLIEEVLAKMGIEVETKYHYWITEEVDGRQRGVRVDCVESNMKP